MQTTYVVLMLPNIFEHKLFNFMISVQRFAKDPPHWFPKIRHKKSRLKCIIIDPLHMNNMSTWKRFCGLLSVFGGLKWRKSWQPNEQIYQRYFAPDNKKVCLVFKHPERLISYEFEYKLFSKLGKEAICIYQLKVVSPANTSLLRYFSLLMEFTGIFARIGSLEKVSQPICLHVNYSLA